MLMESIAAVLARRKQTVRCHRVVGVLNASCLHTASNQHNARHATVKHQIVCPGKVSPLRSVPSHIERPPYASVSKLSRIVRNAWLSNKFSIEIKTEEQIKRMRDACRYYC